MKFIFTELGKKKVSKTIDLSPAEFIDYFDMQKYLLVEADMHLPTKGESELVPVDGLIQDFANQYIVVYRGSVGLGKLLVYR